MPGHGAGVVIVGAGQAASEVASFLRVKGYIAPITILGDEPHLPYQRPPLSKAFLSGDTTVERMLTRSLAAYEKAEITVQTGARVERIDRVTHEVALADGQTMGYETLILATGGRPRRMQVPGSDLRNIFYLRTIDDVEVLKAAFEPGKRLTIVGGGYIGLEVAAVAIKCGMQVVVLEGAARVLARVTAPQVSKFYERFHREAGVEIHTGVTVSGFIAADNGTDVAGVLRGDGGAVICDLVVVGIGLVPNTELAEEAGLMVDAGILVDAEGRTADPDIYAVGDCSTHACHGFLERKVRLESVPNAIEQARIAACSITGMPMPAAAAPWFWSEQYKLKLQMVGISDGYDEIAVRGASENDSFIAFYLKAGHVIAADAVNRPLDFMLAKKLVAEHRCIAATVLSDEVQPLQSLMLPRPVSPNLTSLLSKPGG